MTRRLGTQLIHGGEDLFSMESIRQELKASYGPFALLRVGSSAFLLGMPWFRRTFRDLGVGETAQDLLLKTTHFGMELSSVLAGHGLNAMWNLENPMPLAENALLSAVLTVTHMRGMGWVLSKFARPGGVTEWWMHHRRRLAQADLFQGPMPGASRGIASIFEALLGPQLEYAGIPGSRGRSNFAEALMWHMGKRSDPPDPNKTTLVPLPPDIETLSSRLARLIDSGSAQRNPSEALELLKHLEEVIPLLRREGAFTRKYFNALLFHLPYDHFKTLCHRLIESYPHHPREIQEEIGELLTLYCFCLNKGDRGRTFERLIAVVESQTRPPEASAGPGRDLVGELEEISRLIDDPSVPEAGLSRDTEAVADFVVKMLPRVFDPSRNTSSLTSDIRDLRPLNYETPTQPAPESKMPLAAVVIPKLRGLTNFAKVAARALALTRNPRTATWEDIQAISRAVLELGSPEKAAPEYMAALQAIAKRHPDKKIQQYAQETFDELSKLKD
jgi:hypothetical protein